jgi:hypothetical protein
MFFVACTGALAEIALPGAVSAAPVAPACRALEGSALAEGALAGGALAEGALTGGARS